MLIRVDDLNHQKEMMYNLNPNEMHTQHHCPSPHIFQGPLAVQIENAFFFLKKYEYVHTFPLHHRYLYSQRSS